MKKVQPDPCTSEKLCYNSKTSAGYPCSNPVNDAIEWAFEDRGCVYFIQAGDDGPIKVGWTSRVAGIGHRRDLLQTGNARQLHVRGYLLDLDRGDEKRLHKRFKAHHIRGEWFEPHEDVLAAIPQLRPGVSEWKVEDPTFRILVEQRDRSKPGRWRTEGQSSEVTTRFVDPKTL